MEQGFLCDPPHLPEQQRCGWRPLLEPRGPDPVAFAAREAVLGAGGRGGRLAPGPRVFEGAGCARPATSPSRLPRPR